MDGSLSAKAWRIFETWSIIERDNDMEVNTMSVTVIRHKRRKRASFYVTAEGVELRIPARLPQRVVDSILRDHADWIEARLAAIPQVSPFPENRLFYRGDTLPLIRSSSTRSFTYDGEKFRCPVHWDETTLRDAYERWLRDEALRHVTERAARYERLLRVRASNVRIGHQKTRWGSCSSKGAISINVRLMLAPPEVLDYVIAHEWCHLVHFDHSKAFWEAVASVYPNVAWAKDWLRQNGHTLRI